MAEPAPELQKHQPQIGLHRYRRGTDPGIETRGERREKHRIIQRRRPNSTGNTHSSARRIKSQRRCRLAQPWEVARVVHFLAADASGYITGQVWGVNGGLYM